MASYIATTIACFSNHEMVERWTSLGGVNGETMNEVNKHSTGGLSQVSFWLMYRKRQGCLVGTCFLFYNTWLLLFF